MVLRLRLARVSTPTGAKRHKPFYNIVLAQARSARDGKPMEVLGTYDPLPKTPIGAQPEDKKVKDIKIDVTRTKYWLGVGAQPSDTVWRLLAMIGLLEPRYLPQGPQTLKAIRFPTHVERGEKSSNMETASELGKLHCANGGAQEMMKVEQQIQTGKLKVTANATNTLDPTVA